jgi:DNA-binding cell septation regulator SpoVG
MSNTSSFEVNINRLANPSTKTVAYADVTFFVGDQSVRVSGFAVVNGSKGLFVNDPSRKDGEKWVKTTVLSDELRETLHAAILSEMGVAPAGKGTGKARASQITSEQRAKAATLEEQAWE